MAKINKDKIDLNRNEIKTPALPFKVECVLNVSPPENNFGFCLSNYS
ncbi:hypothetical protein [Clostridium tyrobutyricum]|nr:hypothetical protein [Clostridium tyrobutyricum]